MLVSAATATSAAPMNLRKPATPPLDAAGCGILPPCRRVPVPQFMAGPAAMAELLDPAASVVGKDGRSSKLSQEAIAQSRGATAAAGTTTTHPSRLPHRLVSIPALPLSAAATASAAPRPHEDADAALTATTPTTGTGAAAPKAAAATRAAATAAHTDATTAVASFPLFRAPLHSPTSQTTTSSLVTPPTSPHGYKDHHDDDGTSTESGPQLDQQQHSDTALVEKDVALYTTPTLSILPTPPSSAHHHPPLGKRRGQHALSLSNSSTPRRRGRRSTAAAARILDGHRSPPQPPADMQQTAQHSLVASLLGSLPAGGNGSASSISDGTKHEPSSARGAAVRGRVQVDPATPNGANGTGSSSAQDKHEPANPATLSPVDVREILSHCDDATMSWSLQFWVTIADPLTHHVFFACPASGQCSWEPPVGAFVVPRSPDGEWWELADPSRNNQSYYYNTLTSVTQWNRPDGDAFVIPLGLIQRNALPAHNVSNSENHSARTSSEKANGSLHPSTAPGGSNTSSVRFAQSPVVAVDAPDDDSAPGSHDRIMEPDAASRELPTEGSTSLQQPPPPSQHLSPVASGSSPARSQEDRAGWWDRRKSRKARPRIMDIGPVVGHAENSILPSPPRSPIPINDGSVNLTFQPASPTQAAYDVTHTSFSTDMFADRYFATKRSGVLRTRLPLERIMEWQRNPISSPLLVLSKSSVQDAITTFKVIQHVMGERDRPVDAARAPNGSPSLSLRSKNAEADTSETKMIILEEIRWMLQLGVGRTEMRDEIYCQLIKQLTRNPDQDATVLGFQLFCVFVHAFGPSKSFEPFVQSFLVRNVERTDYGIGIMSKFCLARLDSWLKNGGRGRVLTVAEIEHASDAAFYPSVYGQTLETIMQRQEGAYPELRIPIILPFLADGILALGGTEAEGIFRVPGDQDAIADLKARIDRGHYQLGGIDDPHVTGSLFKMWLRELDEPLVPTKQYNAALEASKDVDNTIIFLKKLPDHNRRVLLFVISFMQLFLDPAVVAVTKMTPSNLALVLAPNILRTTSEELSTVYNNTSFECRFVLNLLLHLDPPSVDPEYVPTHGAGERSSLDESDQEEDEFHETHDDDGLEAERAADV